MTGRVITKLEDEEKDLLTELHPQPKDIDAFGNQLKEPEPPEKPYSGPPAATIKGLILQNRSQILKRLLLSHLKLKKPHSITSTRPVIHPTRTASRKQSIKRLQPKI